MEGQREGRGREGAMSAPPRDVPFREMAATSSSRTFEGSSSSRTFDNLHPTQPSRHQSEPQRQDVWIGAIARLQTQVSFNTSVLESHRRQLVEVEAAIRKLDQDMILIVNGMNRMRDELRARPMSALQLGHDVGDLDVLSRQMQAMTDKVNEMEGLKMQIDLMKNRVRRIEEHDSPAGMPLRADVQPHRQSSFDEPQQSQRQAVPPSQRPLQQPLPPMRTSSMDSPVQSRAPTIQQPPPPMTVLQSQHSASNYYSSTADSRRMSGEQLPAQASSASSFRPGEPLPPPSAMSAWRPTESSHHATGLPPPPPRAPVQPYAVQQEPPLSSWAHINASQATKRSFEESKQSSYESSVVGGSPKRPKLAPIKPRGAYHDDSSYVPSSVTQSTVDPSYNARNRTGSNASQTQSGMLPTPASANTSAYRFITSTAQAESQESWRPEAERMLHIHQHQPGGRARGRGSRAGGRARRGGNAGELQELGTPEWEKPGWTGSQMSPNGYYQPIHPHSPRQNRGELARRGGGMASGSSERAPATPMVQGPHDPFAAGPGPDGQQQTSGGKKSRTKPIRNAEGILIRKDGRPDMRSVSSANNLRKVHAKKEAERAEMEGRTPTSARSLAPAGSNSMSEEDETGDDGDEDDHETTQERHQALMSRIFPQSDDEANRVAGERFFPRQEQQGPSTDKSENRSNERHGSERAQQSTADSQMTDVDARPTSEAQAEEHGGCRRDEEDTKMPNVEEASHKQEAETERMDMAEGLAEQAAPSG